MQGSLAGAAGQGSGAIFPPADLGTNGEKSRYSPETKSITNQGPELSVILKPEGLRQKYMRLEKESRQQMGEEDAISRQRAIVDIRLENERRARTLVTMNVRASSVMIAAMADEQVRVNLTPKQSTQ